jgi:hypothetical protein
MEKIEGEPSRGAGLPCPASLKLQGTINQKAANGDVLPVFHVTSETLAAIQQSLAAGAAVPAGFLTVASPTEKSTGGKRKSSRPKMFGLLLLATGVCLVSGLCYAHHCQTHENHKNSEARNFSCQTKAGRRKSVPDGPFEGKSDKQKPLAEGLAFSVEARPECEARAQVCIYRRVDGRCRTTKQPCRLFFGCEPHGRLDDIRAMLAEIRAGVVGLAHGPPTADEKNRSATIHYHTIGNFHYLTGFNDVWVGGEHFDLSKNIRARLTLKYLVDNHAHDLDSAKHFLTDIEPYVRKKSDSIKLQDIHIKDYFRDPSGQHARLRKLAVIAAGKNGKYFLKTT